MRVAIVSTPRSGNTWLRLLQAKIYSLEELPTQDPMDLSWRRLPERCVVQTHWRRVEPFVSLLEQHGFHVLALARHPLDVLISILHFAPHEPRTAEWLGGEGGSESGILGQAPRSAAFREYATGPRADALLSVTREWWQAPGTIQIRYEDLVENPVGELRRLGKSMDHPVSDAVIDDAIAANSIDALRATARNEHFWQGRPGLWRRLLPATDAHGLERTLSATLRELGYECDPDADLDAAQADANWGRLQ